MRRADRGQRQRADGFRDYILPESLALATPARLRAAMVEPPGAQVRERSGQVLRLRRKAVAGAPREVAMTASLDLELVGQRFRLGLAGCLDALAAALSRRVGPFRVPDPSALEHAGHALRSSLSATQHAMGG